MIAGVNGAGKSTALDAIRILMSRASREILKSRESTVDVGPTDIRRGAEFAVLSVEFGMPYGPARTVYQFEGQLKRNEYVPGKNVGDVRDDGSTTKSGFNFVMPKPVFLPHGGLPLCIFFSPNRSLLVQEASTGTAQTSAFAQALGERRFNLRQAAEWWLAQEALADEHERYGKRADAIQRAIFEFLPTTIQEVRPIPDEEAGHAVLRATKDGQDFDLFELSDGERGILALVFEIARRLAIAYSDLDDPAKDGSACVLIDEIELHLHPQWQREVLGWLQRTFPKCQFIVTTHSPTVVSEIEHERVWIISPEGVWQPDRSLGLDVSRILEEVMGAPARNAEVEGIIEKISRLIDEEQFNKARAQISELSGRLGESDAEVVRAISILTFAEGAVDKDS